MAVAVSVTVSETAVSEPVVSSVVVGLSLSLPLGGYYGGYGLGGYGGYRTYGHSVYGYGKREAEPYYGVYSGHHGVVGYAHHGLAAPVVHTVGHPVVSSYASVSPSASLTTLGAAPAAIPAIGGAYAGAGRYVANSAGTVHV